MGEGEEEEETTTNTERIRNLMGLGERGMVPAQEQGESPPQNSRGDTKETTDAEEYLLSLSQEDLILNGSFSFIALLQSDIIYKVHSANGQPNINHQEEGHKNKQADATYSSGNAKFHAWQESTREEALAEENPWEADLFENININETNEDVAHTGELTNQNNQQETWEQEDLHQQREINTNLEDEDAFLDEDNIEMFLQNEENAASEGNLMNTRSNFKPHLGMQFKTKEEAQEYFNFYSKIVGFSVAIVASSRTVSKKRNNEITRITMKCNKYRKTKEGEKENEVPMRKTTVFAKTDCKVVMVITEK
uniref:Protein FAR1-RELATED SEQUENCE n=1 Tax=Hordeum vulgare subsp. vulgare TaxID=112509 RepID=A0A8I6YLV5_HORVV